MMMTTYINLTISRVNLSHSTTFSEFSCNDLLARLQPKKTTIDRQYLKEVKGLRGLNAAPSVDVPAVVKDVLRSIRKERNGAVRRYSEKFDKWSL